MILVLRGSAAAAALLWAVIAVRAACGGDWEKSLQAAAFTVVAVHRAARRA